MRWLLIVLIVLAANPQAGFGQPAKKPDGNRLAYLDELDPYYPHKDFPKLITPQWVGEDGVEAVVILAIDDMRGHEKWEAYLRPILERLKKIDGRAPVSIMTCKIDPTEPHLQKWLKEGLSLECHTIDHPCPLLGKLDLAGATVYRGVEGYGASGRIHRRAVWRSGDEPITVVAIDSAEKIEKAIPYLDRMVGSGLVAISDADVILYRETT